MAELLVDTNKFKINFDPQTIEDEVYQNVVTTVTTIRGQVPLDRSLGISGEHTDKPLDVVKARLNQDIVESLAKGEPRATVLQIFYDENAQTIDGQLRPILRISIDEQFT